MYQYRNHRAREFVKGRNLHHIRLPAKRSSSILDRPLAVCHVVLCRCVDSLGASYPSPLTPLVFCLDILSDVQCAIFTKDFWPFLTGEVWVVLIVNRNINNNGSFYVYTLLKD